MQWNPKFDFVLSCQFFRSLIFLVNYTLVESLDFRGVFCPNFFHNRTSVKLPYHIRNSWPGRAPLEFPKYVIIFGPQLFFKKLTFKMYVLSSSLNCMAKLWLDKSRLTFASVVRRSAMPNLLLIPKLRLVR